MMKKLLVVLSLFIMQYLIYSTISVQANENKSEDNVTIQYNNSTLEISIPNEPKEYKTRFRAAWISTFENKDFSGQTDSSTVEIEKFKNEFNTLLDTLSNHNMNVIIFEVRPLNDAFYNSELNPWSKFLTNKEGINPGWDPLTWMIKSTHERGIEFHSWVNPYLVSNTEIINSSTKDTVIAGLDDQNYAKLHPEYLVVGKDKKLYLNPGISEVQQFFVDTVLEIINNYDTDAIHIGDVIYPEQGLDDSYDSWLIKESSSIEEFRESNVTTIFRLLSNRINSYNIQNNKAVQLGLSIDNMKKNYIDINYIIEQKYVDYIIPKVFQPTDNDDYISQVMHWTNVVKDSDINLYIGQDLENQSGLQLEKQLYVNQSLDLIKGVSLNNFKNLVNNESVSTLLRDSFWKEVALLPAVETVYTSGINDISDLRVSLVGEEIHLSWNKVEYAKQYVIYKFINDEDINLEDPNRIITILNHNSSQDDSVYYVDTNVTKGNHYKYFISAVDYANRETLPTLQGINVIEDNNLELQVILFSIISVLGVSIIGYSSIKLLKSI